MRVRTWATRSDLNCLQNKELALQSQESMGSFVEVLILIISLARHSESFLCINRVWICSLGINILARAMWLRKAVTTWKSSIPSMANEPRLGIKMIILPISSLIRTNVGSAYNASWMILPSSEMISNPL